MTQYLLDTHVLYWAKLTPQHLSASARDIVEDSNNGVWYSVVTPWELTIKQARGKLKVPDEFYLTLSTLGLACLPIQQNHVNALRALPLIHRDPFDRMLVAQAKAENLTLITRDRNLMGYPIKTLIA